MRKMIKILTVSCLCAAFAGPMVSHADAVKSVHETTLVAAPADYANIAVSQVTDYVNIREQATTASKIVGKIYNNCAATIQETVTGEDGTWYRIQSGTVNGYIKAQYFITGEEAEKLAQSIGREFVTINVESLRLRSEPNLTSSTLTLLSQGARYVVQAEEGEFFKVEVDADLVGYIAQSYCVVEVEFDQAVSLEEERQKLEEESQRKREAESAMAALEQVKRVEANREAAAGTTTTTTTAETTVDTENLIIAANPEQSDNSASVSAPTTAAETKPAAQTQAATTTKAPASTQNAPSGSGNTSSGSSGNTTSVGPGSAAVVSATRTAIVAYAKQFLGNPYVFGGTSLTNGADCSGFTQGVFAHFGITTGRSSRDQAVKGKQIDVSAAQPGDLLFYGSGDYINHVALYIGGGQVIHASNSTTGIIISPYNYRTPCKAVTFLD
ncbi:MAG: SH3 domain-containing C40 family peptidase [Lachnospiraceae bacterium]|nr:SH3 domain-containing C40 family peptidase [Lachnospiraceae bacterium]